MAVPLAAKVRWLQTSTDVSAFLTLPAGTRAKDVTVDITPTHLVVRLGWYGRVLDGVLHRPVKAREAQWCLEDEDLHLLLPKDGAQVWWKALFEGGEGKGYYEILKEAVDADEPVTAYDEMEEGAKDLLDSMLERQAYINAGLIDPEGFDDFRVVIGENSLGGGGAVSGTNS
jgi:CS domain